MPLSGAGLFDGGVLTVSDAIPIEGIAKFAINDFFADVVGCRGGADLNYIRVDVNGQLFSGPEAVPVFSKFKRDASIKVGDWFILAGQMLLVAAECPEFALPQGKKDVRLRVILCRWHRKQPAAAIPGPGPIWRRYRQAHHCAGRRPPVCRQPGAGRSAKRHTLCAAFVLRSSSSGGQSGFDSQDWHHRWPS